MRSGATGAASPISRQEADTASFTDPCSRFPVPSTRGSRGIYGAIALAGAWGLPRGCAVAYTDKGAGTGYFDIASQTGVALDGSRQTHGSGDLEFEPDANEDTVNASPYVATRHAHSRDNPEADWGRHVHDAARFGLQMLDAAYPQHAPFTEENTRIMAVGVSNGGGAVLRAAEQNVDWLDGVVAISPNIYAGSGRALYDYVSEAALWMPCALLTDNFVDVLVPSAMRSAWQARCRSLIDAGLMSASMETAPKIALEHLRTNGWTDAAIRVGAMSVQFDLWRSAAVTYASSYSRSGFSDMPCGYGFAATDDNGIPRPADAPMRAAWWSDASGIPPGAGIDIIDGLAKTGNADTVFAGLRCLRDLWTDADSSLRIGVETTRAELPRDGLSIMVIHGANDGLIPETFSGAAYARWAKAAGRNVTYWQVKNAQHFDAFLGLPAYGAHFVPLMPYAYRAFDAMWAHVVEGAALPADAYIAAIPRQAIDGVLAPLQAANLAMPK